MSHRCSSRGSAMELHEDEEDAVSIGLHRSFAQDSEVLESVVAAIVDAQGDADPAIFKKAQVIVSALVFYRWIARRMRCTRFGVTLSWFSSLVCLGLRRVSLSFRQLDSVSWSGNWKCDLFAVM